MSTPKPAKVVLNPRIKISKTGRPYVDVADLVKTKLDRIEKSRDQGQNGATADESRNANIADNNDNNSNSCER